MSPTEYCVSRTRVKPSQQNKSINIQHMFIIIKLFVITIVTRNTTTLFSKLFLSLSFLGVLTCSTLRITIPCSVSHPWIAVFHDIQIVLPTSSFSLITSHEGAWFTSAVGRGRHLYCMLFLSCQAGFSLLGSLCTPYQ